MVNRFDWIIFNGGLTIGHLWPQPVITSYEGKVHSIVKNTLNFYCVRANFRWIAANLASEASTCCD
jgi:hypothetical protein